MSGNQNDGDRGTDLLGTNCSWQRVTTPLSIPMRHTEDYGVDVRASCVELLITCIIYNVSTKLGRRAGVLWRHSRGCNAKAL